MWNSARTDKPVTTVAINIFIHISLIYLALLLQESCKWPASCQTLEDIIDDNLIDNP